MKGRRERKARRQRSELLLLAALCTTMAAPACVTAQQPDLTAGATEIPRDADPYDEHRESMVAAFERRGIDDPEVLSAMRAVPRHLFVPDDLLALAYTDRALPIGYGQTISQPYVVAWMTELLELSPGDRVLEIGTGSAYQAAVLAEMPGVEVYTIEIVPELAERARARLGTLGHTAVTTMQGDGYYGWEEHAPFDAIVVTAAPDHLPPPLVEQLAPGGRLVIPIGPRGGLQTMWKYDKAMDGRLTAENQGGVVFVPFTGVGHDSGAEP